MKQFPKEFKDLLKSIFAIHYNSNLTSKHSRMLKILLDKNLGSSWDSKTLKKDFIDDSNPDAYTKLINLCDIIIRKYPSPIRKKKDRSTKSSVILLRRIARLIGN